MVNKSAFLTLVFSVSALKAAASFLVLNKWHQTKKPETNLLTYLSQLLPWLATKPP